MTANELIYAVKKVFSKLEDPEDIFRLHEEFENMEEDEKRKFRNNRDSEALGMLYISAVEMKKEGTWEKYVEECKQPRKTAEEIEKELYSLLHENLESRDKEEF